MDGSSSTTSKVRGEAAMEYIDRIHKSIDHVGQAGGGCDRLLLAAPFFHPSGVIMIRGATFFFIALSAFATGIPAGLRNHPLAFEPNRGQAAAPVRFVARGNSRDYLLSGSGVTVMGASLRFSGANSEPQAIALDLLAERHNYFHGTVGQTDIPTYRRVRY